MISTTARDALKAAGFRATKPRIAVYELLSSTHTPLSADDIHKRIGRSGIDRVTVYRTVEAFEQAKLLKSVDLKRGAVLYEVKDANDHHHLVCRQCGIVEDFAGCDIDKIAQNALKRSKSFTSVSDHSLELFGTCTSCTR
jgi:Fe2+ or Zn2+ uptake regulation protein